MGSCLSLWGSLGSCREADGRPSEPRPPCERGSLPTYSGSARARSLFSTRSGLSGSVVLDARRLAEGGGTYSADVRRPSSRATVKLWLRSKTIVSQLSLGRAVP